MGKSTGGMVIDLMEALKTSLAATKAANPIATIYTSTDATLSADGVYRYTLRRRWIEVHDIKRFVVIGLNPSTADAQRDDPTIRRCVAFAKREQCDELVMLNLFGLRSTDPTALIAHPDPVGALNDAAIAASIDNAHRVVAAWGANAQDFPIRLKTVLADLRHVSLLCFGVTRDGHPRHPLYVRGDTPLVPFRPDR